MTEESVPPDDERAGQSVPPVKAGIISQLSTEQSNQLASLTEVPLSLQIRLGEATVPLSELLELESGSVLTLDQGLEELVEVLAGGKVIARGEIVAVGDQLGVRILEVAASEDTPPE